MAQLFDHIEYLSREIGARPAGTEEEQQSALYIADQLQRESGFHAEIEEFTSASNLEGARAIPAVVIVLVVILAMLFNVLTVPALLLSLVAAGVYVLEANDKPIVSKAFSRGASQNVVAKYQPANESGEAGRRVRSRKIVLVAHYDSGKVKPRALEMIDSLGVPVGLVVLGGMAATLFFLIIRIFLGGAGGVATIVLNVLTVIALVPVLLPIVKSVLYRIAPYNEGANNNASGVAAVIEVARRISTGSVSEADLAAYGENIVMHGEEALAASGLVPEGVPVSYQQADSEEDQNYSEEERLLAAKAAIAALTGHPVESHLFGTTGAAAPASRSSVPEPQDAQQGVQPQALEENEELAKEAPLAPTVDEVEGVAPAAVSAAPAPGVEVDGFENAPSWFVSAQRNAKKSATEVSDDQRSRYNQAIENTEREMAERERQREEEERARRAAQAQASIERLAADVEAVPELEHVPELEPVPETEPEEAPAPQSEPEPVLAPELESAPEPIVLDPAPVTPESDPEPESASASEAEPAAPAPEDVDLGQTVAYNPLQLQQLAIDSEPSEQPAPDTPEQPAPPELEAVPEPDLEPTRPAAALEDLPAIGEEPAAPAASIAPAAPVQSSVPENTNPSRSGLFRKLRTDVPSMSGVIRMQQAGEDVSQVPARPNSRPNVRANARPNPRPVPRPSVAFDVPDPAEPASQPVDYDMEVAPLVNPVESQPAQEPAQEPAAQEPATPAAPSAVEVPTSRAGGFFGKFRKKGPEALDETPQEWLDVDKDFDARTVGRERGGWESFRDESGTAAGGAGQGQGQGQGQGRNWQGGGFSRVHLDYVDTRSGDDARSDTPDELVESVEDRILNEEIGQIIHFRNPEYNNEVWFVAIGSDTEVHDGAREFVNAHRNELRGAMVIEVESLGAGTLAVASEEGQFRRTKASSRIKRFMRPAIEATGIVPDEVAISGADSIASTIQKEGFQTMHLFGAEDGAPALKGSADDVVENVDELALEENVNFLMELLKHS